jgi:peptidoglycan/LPS O-acetylase OafA/YrhL
VDDAAPPLERLHALDSLRAVAMLLGIVLHAMMSFVAWPFDWPAHDVYRSHVFDGLVYLVHGFRMPLFFLVAGFFAHLLVQRLGVRGFARQRARRIGIPFLAGMLLVIPLIALIWLWADPAGLAEIERKRPRSLLTYPTAHLWFLQMLMILYALAIGGHAAMQRAPASWMQGLDAGFDWLVQRWYKPLLFVPPTVVLLSFGPFVPEIDLSGRSLLPGWQAVGYYGLFFGVGWWLHRRMHLLETLRRWLPLSFCIAAACFLLAGTAVQALAQGRGDPVAMKLLAWGAAAGYSWTMTFAVTGLFLKIAARQREWMRYLADASYWWYLWHIPPVMVLQAVVAPWTLHPALKLLVIIGGAVAVLWPTYQLFVRYTWIGALLNGPRSRPLPVARAAPA